MGNQVLITGSRGIAAGLAVALAKKNYQIYLLGGEAEDSKSLAKDHSQIVGYSAIDLRDETEVEKGFNDAISKLGGLDHVISIAGGSGRSFGDGPVEMRETNKRGGIAIGIASNELRRYGLNEKKRSRLIKAGADVIVPDFSQLPRLLSLLNIKN